MRVGGPAQRLVTVKTTDELVDAIREVDDADEPLLVIAGGSNLVVSDEGFAGSAVRIATSGISVESGDAGGVLVRVAAGEVWDDVVVQAVEQGWSGIEALSGIPGCAGATPVQNVGAYGQEVAQSISSVLVWDRREQRVHTFANADCRFTYRHSMFKAEPRYVVGERVPLQDAREAVLAQRRQRGMVLDAADHDTFSCGSFFTNPVMSASSYAALQDRAQALLGTVDNPVRVPRFDSPDGQVKTAAAWLIERAGFSKGYRMPGPAALSTKHVLAVTNRGSATTADILTLAREVRDGVEDAFGVTLVNEPVLVGTSL